MSELARLGKDPAKTTSEAATGDANRVFDLNLALIDQDGPGGDPPTSVSINWSEVLIGDYDQNGLVNVSDLTPLGRELNGTVAYDDAAFHGGFAGWPAGDPIDDGGETPPSAGSPAANWRLARIDGDRNGLLTQADITPIAVHWQEALSGYRIYRQAPGESQFTIVPGKAGTSDGLSVDHPAAPGNAPVLYGFEDDNTTASGVYLYYVAPYDLQSQQQGPASGIVSIDLDTGTVNSSPVASLSVTPDFAGAPAEITLDASASYDPDGSIAAYEWDFDGDGTMDWLSTDPLPETSSDGTVDSFVEVEPGKMRASYNRGNADYLHPSVTATDDLSAASLPVDAQLGISGWVDSEFIWSDADPRISFNPERFFHDDINDRLVCTGPSKDNETMYMATRTGFEQWVEEVIYTTDNPVIQEFVKGKGILFNRAWPAFLSDGSPIAFIHIGWGSAFPAVFTMFLGEKKSGSWQIRHLYEHPEGFVNPGYSSFTRIGPDQFAIHCGETDTSIPLNMSARYFVIFYDNGDLSVEYIGYGEYTEDKWAYINFIANSANANLICPFEYYVDLQNPQPELHWYERQGPDDWELQSMNFDSEPGLLDVLRFMNISVDSAGTMNLLMASEPATFDDRKAFLLRITGQKQEFIELPTELPVVATFSGHTGMLIETDLGVLIMIGLDPTLPSAPNSNVYTWSQSWLSDENLLFVEDIAKTYEDGVNPRETTGARLIVDSPSLETICVVSGWLYEYGTDDEKGNGAKVLKRVDPRSN